ncbi:IS66-like element accessory protein TnpA [Inquilinus sp.]|uniref:IS66-like element accessory protein TnpA n=1 Tax=Inquilinus sp. TaxID=1932117 RepID=UPI0037845AA9
MEIFTGAGRRRNWSPEEKATIVAESYGEGGSVCAVARRHGLTPQQLFTWRRQARQPAEDLPAMFVPAVVETAQPEPAAASAPKRRARRRSQANGIEFEIGGVEVRVGADANPRAIAAVIQALKAGA